MKKKLMVALIVFVLSIAMLAHKPIIRGDVKLSADYYEAVESQAKGFYSYRLPLLAVYVSVERMEADKVFYTIYYAPFGTVDMSYSQEDGYNIEKEVSPI